MAFDDFVRLAKQQDIRNHFEGNSGDLSYIPTKLQLFYKTQNPINVEIMLSDSTSIRFSPEKYLRQLQEEYGFTDSSFIFATQEGDPIYLKSDGIFSCPHGVDLVDETKITDTFESYIEMLSKEIRAVLKEEPDASECEVIVEVDEYETEVKINHFHASLKKLPLMKGVLKNDTVQNTISGYSSQKAWILWSDSKELQNFHLAYNKLEANHDQILEKVYEYILTEPVMPWYSGQNEKYEPLPIRWEHSKEDAINYLRQSLAIPWCTKKIWSVIPSIIKKDDFITNKLIEFQVLLLVRE